MVVHFLIKVCTRIFFPSRRSLLKTKGIYEVYALNGISTQQSPSSKRGVLFISHTRFKPLRHLSWIGIRFRLQNTNRTSISFQSFLYFFYEWSKNSSSFPLFFIQILALRHCLHRPFAFSFSVISHVWERVVICNRVDLLLLNHSSNNIVWCRFSNAGGLFFRILFLSEICWQRVMLKRTPHLFAI